MNLYETVKGRVTPQMAAERYDLPVNRSGMACCPFHNDRTPSMKLYPDHFHCFGCGQTGDVIDLTAQLTGQNARDAAGRLATDFGIPMQTGEDTAPRPAKEIPYHLTRQFRESERLCFSVLTDYLHLLRGWKVRCAPNAPDESLDDRFVEACQMLEYVEYLADLLIAAELEQRIRIVEMLNKEDLIASLEERLERQKKEETPYEEKQSA